VHGHSPATRKGGPVHDDRRAAHASQRAPRRAGGRVGPATIRACHQSRRSGSGWARSASRRRNRPRGEGRRRPGGRVGAGVAGRRDPARCPAAGAGTRPPHERTASRRP
jgi:hypothetical protein